MRHDTRHLRVTVERRTAAVTSAATQSKSITRSDQDSATIVS